MNWRGCGKWGGAWPSRHGLLVLAFLVAGAFLLFAQWQVLTYVCGNDPMLYIQAARILLQPDLYGPEAVRHSLTFVAPGYPFFLAGLIKLFGDLAPYWSNMAVLLAMLPLMWFVFRRLMGSDRAAAFSILALLLIIFSGHPLHAPFLLYPFREVPRLFLVYFAYALLLIGMGPHGNRVLPILVASLALLVACTIREPTALVLPGLLLGMAGLASPWRDRCVAWAWFLAPWVLLGAIGLVIVSYHGGLSGFSQFSVLHYLGNHDVALARIQQMLAWFPGRVGWIGLLFIGVGIFRAVWTSRVLLAWLLVPATLFFVFYAYMQMHDRYFLTSLLFLAVFAGYGLDWACRGAQRLLMLIGLGNIWPERFGAGLTVIILGLLAAGLYQTAGQLRPWGPKVQAGEVREWQELVAGLEPSPDGRVRIAVEQRTRYLEDMLMSYTDVDLLDPKRIDQWPREWATAHYFHPLNRQAIWSTPQWLMYLEVVALRLLEHRMDLELVGAGQPETYRIGGGEYARYRLSPWRPGPHEQILELAPGEAQVLWMDWASTDPAIAREIVLSDARTGAEWLRFSAQGNGLQAFYLPAEMVVAPEAVLTVRSSAPLPSRPVIAVIQASETQHFALGGDRRLSTNLFFPQMRPEDARPDSRLVRTDRDLIVTSPKLLSPVAAHWDVFLQGRFSELGPELFIRGTIDSGFGFVRDPGAGGGALRFPVDSEKVLSLRLVAPHAPVDRREVALEGVGFLVRVEE